MNTKILKIIGIVAIVLVAAILITKVPSLLKTYHLNSTSNKFISAVLSNQPSISYELFTSDARAQTSKVVWTSQVERFSTIFKTSEPNKLQSYEANGFTIVTYSLVGSDRKNYTFTLILKSSNSQWKVESFTSTLST